MMNCIFLEINFRNLYLENYGKLSSKNLQDISTFEYTLELIS